MKRILIATVIGVATLTAGCTGGNGGTTGAPKPDPTSGGSTPTSASSKLDSIKACDLLTESEAKSLGYTYPGDDSIDSTAADGCDWTISGKGGTVVGVRPNKGVNDLELKGDKVSDIKVGQFAAKKIEGTNGDAHSCSIVISVTEKSSVSIISTSGSSGDTATACERSSKFADLVVPKLS